MALGERFPYLGGMEASSPHGVWGWAKRLVDQLLKWKWFDLLDQPVNDKPYYVMRVNADGTGVEYAPEELGLTGAALTGLANQIIRVKPTEDGYFISKEVLHTLIGVALAAKPHYHVRINNTSDGFEYAQEVLYSLIGVSLVGKAGYSIKVNPGETGFILSL